MAPGRGGGGGGGGGGAMTEVTVATWVRVSLTALIVIEYVPGGAVPGERVSVALAAAGPIVTLAGSTVAVDPAGFPDTDSETVPLKAPDGVIVNVLAASVPGVLVTLAGLAATEKSSGAGAGAVAGFSARTYARA